MQDDSEKMKQLLKKSCLKDTLSKYDIELPYYWRIHDGKIIIGVMRPLEDKACMAVMTHKIDKGQLRGIIGVAVLRNICKLQARPFPRLHDIRRRHGFNAASAVRGGSPRPGYSEFNDQICSIIDIIVRFGKNPILKRPFESIMLEIEKNPMRDNLSHAKSVNTAVKNYNNLTLHDMLAALKNTALDEVKDYRFDCVIKALPEGTTCYLGQQRPTSSINSDAPLPKM